MLRDGSSVMFPLGSWGFLGLSTSDPPHPNDPVGIDLTPTPIPAANLRIHTRRKQKKNDHRKGSIYILWKNLSWVCKVHRKLMEVSILMSGILEIEYTEVLQNNKKTIWTNRLGDCGDKERNWNAFGPEMWQSFTVITQECSEQ